MFFGCRFIHFESLLVKTDGPNVSTHSTEYPRLESSPRQGRPHRPASISKRHNHKLWSVRPIGNNRHKNTKENGESRTYVTHRRWTTLIRSVAGGRHGGAPTLEKKTKSDEPNQFILVCQTGKLGLYFWKQTQPNKIVRASDRTTDDGTQSALFTVLVFFYDFFLQNLAPVDESVGGRCVGDRAAAATGAAPATHRPLRAVAPPTDIPSSQQQQQQQHTHTHTHTHTHSKFPVKL